MLPKYLEERACMQCQLLQWHLCSSSWPQSRLAGQNSDRTAAAGQQRFDPSIPSYSLGAQPRS